MNKRRFLSASAGKLAMHATLAAMLLAPTMTTAQEKKATAGAAGSIRFQGAGGAGKGKNVVLIAGDDEYRSEEALPMLAKILSLQHGFDTTVCFSVDGKGTIAPEAHKSLTNSAAIEKADLLVLLIRFRNWDDASMKRFENYYLAGKPFIAIRTSTHPFNLDPKSPYAKWTWDGKDGGFGKTVFGETWVSHWGSHKVEATRGVLEEANQANPILKGVKDLFGPTDVYEAHPPKEATVLVRGAVLTGMKPEDKPVADKRNSPMMPVVWTLDHKNPAGKTNKVLTTTMGSATDFTCEDLRRLIVNGVYWAVGLEVPAQASAEIVGPYEPVPYGFGNYRKGIQPTDHLPTATK